MAARQLAIKTGVVNRLVKEVSSYKAEAVELELKVQTMESANADEYEVRQQKRVLAESVAMIPDSEKRLAKAVADLEELVETTSDELAESDEFQKAKLALIAAGAKVETADA